MSKELDEREIRTTACSHVVKEFAPRKRDLYARLDKFATSEFYQTAVALNAGIDRLNKSLPQNDRHNAMVWDDYECISQISHLIGCLSRTNFDLPDAVHISGDGENKKIEPTTLALLTQDLKATTVKRLDEIAAQPLEAEQRTLVQACLTLADRLTQANSLSGAEDFDRLSIDLREFNKEQRAALELKEAALLAQTKAQHAAQQETQYRTATNTDRTIAELLSAAKDSTREALKRAGSELTVNEALDHSRAAMLRRPRTRQTSPTSAAPYAEVGEKFAAILQNKGLSLRDVEDATVVSYGSLYSLLKGKTLLPDTLNKLNKPKIFTPEEWDNFQKLVKAARDRDHSTAHR